MQEEVLKGNLVSLHSVTWDIPALYLGRWGPWDLAMFELFFIHTVK